jgi:predicted DNA-binding WGR domain protein
MRLSGATVTCEYAAIGKPPMTQTKAFDSEANARKHFDKVEREKRAKGYAEAGSGAAARPAPKAEAGAAEPKAARRAAAADEAREGGRRRWRSEEGEARLCVHGPASRPLHYAPFTEAACPLR